MYPKVSNILFLSLSATVNNPVKSSTNYFHKVCLEKNNEMPTFQAACNQPSSASLNKLDKSQPKLIELGLSQLQVVKLET